MRNKNKKRRQNVLPEKSIKESKKKKKLEEEISKVQLCQILLTDQVR